MPNAIVSLSPAHPRIGPRLHFQAVRLLRLRILHRTRNPPRSHRQTRSNCRVRTRTKSWLGYEAPPRGPRVYRFEIPALRTLYIGSWAITGARWLRCDGCMLHGVQKTMRTTAVEEVKESLILVRIETLGGSYLKEPPSNFTNSLHHPTHQNPKTHPRKPHNPSPLKLSHAHHLPIAIPQGPGTQPPTPQPRKPNIASTKLA